MHGPLTTELAGETSEACLRVYALVSDWRQRQQDVAQGFLAWLGCQLTSLFPFRERKIPSAVAEERLVHRAKIFRTTESSEHREERAV
jgi:hypothetical protein